MLLRSATETAAGMAGRVVHAHVGKSPHGSEEGGRLGGKVYSTQFHSDHEKDTNGSNGNTHQYNGESLYSRHSHQHGYQHGHQQHGHHQFQNYDEELHPHGCMCTSCTCTSEAYCPPIIDLVSARKRKISLYFTNFASLLLYSRSSCSCK